MEMNTISAASNPTFANDLVAKAMAEPVKQIEPAEITAPSDTTVTLPGGYITSAGEVIKTAEVRELTGADEEAIAKASNMGRAFNVILSRATETVGGMKATDTILDEMFAGDRDALMVGIYRATFGDTVESDSFCSTCEKYHTIEIDVTKDLTTKTLSDPLESGQFTVKGKGHEYVVRLPTGVAQREVLGNTDKTGAELTTLLLENTVIEIDGRPLLSKNQIRHIGLADRRLIGKELETRTFGPQFENLNVACPDCGEELEVPFNLGTLFRF